MMHEMITALDAADADDGVRAIVTGEGRGFCAGADLEKGGDTFDYDAQGRSEEESALPPRDGGGLLTLRIYECNKPMIAAVNGPAVGVGATMQLPMDIRLASENAKFGFVFSRRGIVPEACSSYFLPRVVGISQALEWAYSGRVFQAQEALAGGLVKEVLAPDALLPRAREIAREIAENTSAISVTLIRHMMWRMLGADHWRKAQDRFPGRLRNGPRPGREGRGHVLPRKAPPGLHRQAEHGYAWLLPLVGPAGLWLRPPPTTHKQKEIAHERCRHCPEAPFPVELTEGQKVFWCSCGRSSKQPFAMAPIRARSSLPWPSRRRPLRPTTSAGARPQPKHPSVTGPTTPSNPPRFAGTLAPARPRDPSMITRYLQQLTGTDLTAPDPARRLAALAKLDPSKDREKLLAVMMEDEDGAVRESALRHLNDAALCVEHLATSGVGGAARVVLGELLLAGTALAPLMEGLEEASLRQLIDACREPEHLSRCSRP